MSKTFPINGYPFGPGGSLKLLRRCESLNQRSTAKTTAQSTRVGATLKVMFDQEVLVEDRELALLYARGGTVFLTVSTSETAVFYL